MGRGFWRFKINYAQDDFPCPSMWLNSLGGRFSQAGIRWDKCIHLHDAEKSVLA